MSRRQQLLEMACVLTAGATFWHQLYVHLTAHPNQPQPVPQNGLPDLWNPVQHEAWVAYCRARAALKIVYMLRVRRPRVGVGVLHPAAPLVHGTPACAPVLIPDNRHQVANFTPVSPSEICQDIIREEQGGYVHDWVVSFARDGNHQFYAAARMAYRAHNVPPLYNIDIHIP
jgi:hypothetical protein